MQKIFIGRKQEVDLLKKAFKPVNIPTRSLLFIVGPSGIGKTALSKKVLEELRKESNIITIYIDFGRTYSNLQEALQDLVRGFEKHVLDYKSAFEKFMEKLRSMKNKISEISTPIVSLRPFEEQPPPLQFFQDLIDSFVNELSECGYLATIVIDELQNFLRFTNWSAWGLVKFFMSQQEKQGNVQFVFTTSDYIFRKRILSDRIPVEYIDTFYLGEMTKEDSIELLEEIMKRASINKNIEHKMIENIVDQIGGVPALLYNLINYSVKYEMSINDVLRYFEKRVYEDLVEKLKAIRKSTIIDHGTYYEDAGWSKVKNYLVKLADSPISISEINMDIFSEIDKLVDSNILQYACKEYLGIYKWNKEKSGGMCYLDVIAPSNRLYYRALKDYVSKNFGA